MNKLIVIFFAASMLSEVHAGVILPEERKSAEDVFAATSEAPERTCLSRLLQFNGSSMTAIGESLVSSDHDKLIIYSPNNRTTLVTAEGNCHGLTQLPRSYDGPVESAFHLAKKLVQENVSRERALKPILANCMKSNVRIIRETARITATTLFDSSPPKTSGSPIRSGNPGEPTGAGR